MPTVICRTTTPPGHAQRGRQGKVLISVWAQKFLTARRAPFASAFVSFSRICICILHFNCKWKQLSKLVEILKRRIERAPLFTGVARNESTRCGPTWDTKTFRRIRMRNALHIFGARPAWISVKKGPFKPFAVRRHPGHQIRTSYCLEIVGCHSLFRHKELHMD